METPRIDRREALKLGGASAAVVAIPSHAAQPALAASGFVVDTRFPTACAAATPSGAWRHETDGDVTALWVGRLDRAWNGQSQAVAGITGEDALFVLEHLAWGRWRRVILRQPLPDVAGPVPLVRWLIATQVARA